MSAEQYLFRCDNPNCGSFYDNDLELIKAKARKELEDER